MSVLFEYFKAVNKGDFDFVNRMSDEEVKSISPYVLLSWMHGAAHNAPHHIILTDLYCNDYVFRLQKHPRLLLKTFIEANSEMGDTKYNFVKPPTKKSDKNVQAISRYYDVTLKDAADYATILSDDEIDEIREIIDQVE